MGHEVIAYGRIVGAHWRAGEQFVRTYQLNEEAISGLPSEDEYPSLVRGMFSAPMSYPIGTYRSQVFHFGASFKDEPGDELIWQVAFVGKFESFLRRLCWFSAVLHLETEFVPLRTYRWEPTESAYARLFDDPPCPISEWRRSVEPAA